MVICSINVGLSTRALELFTRFETGHRCSKLSGADNDRDIQQVPIYHFSTKTFDMYGVAQSPRNRRVLGFSGVRRTSMRLPLQLVLFGFAVLLSAVVLADPVKLKLGHFANDNTVAVFKAWAEAVNAAANGAIQIDVFPNGALGRNLAQQAQLIDSGVQDIGFVVPGITPGRFPDNVVLELPGLFNDMREATRVYTSLVGAHKLRGYDDFYAIDEFATPPFSIHLRKPIKDLDELKGLKIRAGNATEANMLKELGAVPILIPVNEIAEAVGRGTIDGTTAQPQTMIDFGIDRVTSFHYMAHLGPAPLAELMNRKVFEGLPPAGQDAIRKYSGEWLADKYLTVIGPIMDGYMRRLRNDPKHTVVEPSAEDQRKWDAAVQRVISAWVAKDPRNGELLQTVKAEIAKVRADK
jgi:TRAP-type C4-dicarboxylate transport system substrate-binding protein